MAKNTHARRMSEALEYRVGSPLRLLALAVVGSAVDDAREGKRVGIGPEWLSDVEPSWLAEEGVAIVDTMYEDLAPTQPLHLGARIAELRAKTGLKQAEVGRRVGVDYSVASLWEQNRRPVPRYRLDALAEALETTVDDLLRDVPSDVRPRVHPRVQAPEPAVIVELPPVPEVQPPEPEPQPRLHQELAWCNHDHGTGVYRVHHHGPKSHYGPLPVVTDARLL